MVRPCRGRCQARAYAGGGSVWPTKSRPQGSVGKGGLPPLFYHAADLNPTRTAGASHPSQLKLAKMRGSLNADEPEDKN